MRALQASIDKLLGRASMSMVSSKVVFEKCDIEGSMQLLGNCLLMLGETMKNNEFSSLSTLNQYDILDLLERAKAQFSDITKSPRFREL